MPKARIIGPLMALALSACVATPVNNGPTAAGDPRLSGDLIVGEWYFGEEEFGSRYLRGIGFNSDGVTIVSFRCEPEVGRVDVFHDIGPVTSAASTLRIITASGTLDVAMRPHDIRGWVGSLRGDDPSLGILDTAPGRFAIEQDGVVQRLPWEGSLRGILIDCDA